MPDEQANYWRVVIRDAHSKYRYSFTTGPCDRKVLGKTINHVMIDHLPGLLAQEIEKILGPFEKLDEAKNAPWK